MEATIFLNSPQFIIDFIGRRVSSGNFLTLQTSDRHFLHICRPLQAVPRTATQAPNTMTNPDLYY